MSTIVLETSGKHESVDYATIHLFEDRDSALSFCIKKQTGRTKYWTLAEIVEEGQEIELAQPDWEEE